MGGSGAGAAAVCGAVVVGVDPDSTQATSPAQSSETLPTRPARRKIRRLAVASSIGLATTISEVSSVFIGECSCKLRVLQYTFTTRIVCRQCRLGFLGLLPLDCHGLLIGRFARALE